MLFSFYFEFGSRNKDENGADDLTVSISHSNTYASPRKQKYHGKAVWRHCDTKNYKSDSKRDNSTNF